MFVNFDNAAEPLDDFIAEYAGEFGAYQQEKFRLNKRYERTLDCNWKLVHENFVDIYHFLTLHPDSLPNWQGPEEYDYRAHKHGGYATFYENYLPPPLIGLQELGMPEWLENWPEGMDPARRRMFGIHVTQFHNLRSGVRDCPRRGVAAFGVAIKDGRLLHGARHLLRG